MRTSQAVYRLADRSAHQARGELTGMQLKSLDSALAVIDAFAKKNWNLPD